eukprot:PhF_6_TR15653/c0_g2_i2/m.24325/K04412/STK3, MST2; serine/threonine kinase 3
MTSPDVLDYLRKKNIPHILNDLVQAMITQRPENMTAFAEEWFRGLNTCEPECESNNEPEDRKLVVQPDLTNISSPEGLYELGLELGRGHYSRVYEATRKSDSLPVAIKITPVRDPRVTEEYDVMIACGGSDYVVQAVDCHYNNSSNEFWIVMERLSESLEGFLPNSEEELCDTLYQMTRALAWVHERGYVHLDVKPSNFLRRNDTIVLSDFGLATHIGTAAQQVGDFTIMSPEVFYERGLYYSSCDTWGLGISALILADGRSPLNTEDSVDDIFYFLDRNRVSPSLKQANMWSMEFVDFLSRCFHRNPEDRETAQQLTNHVFFKQSDAQK